MDDSTRLQLTEENVFVDIPKYVKIVSEMAPLYLGDDISYSGMGVVKEGQILDVAAMSVDTGWYAVRYDDRYLMWVDPQYCDVLNEKPEEDPESVEWRDDEDEIDGEDEEWD